MRIDKYIWSVRLAKTRSLAIKMCNAEKVTLNQNLTKPSKEINHNDIIGIKYQSAWREYKVVDVPKSRIGPKLVSTYLLEITPASTLELIKQIDDLNKQNNLSGIKGRPTKKDRRNLESFKNK